MLALRKRAEVDSKYLITFSPNDAYELSLLTGVPFLLYILVPPNGKLRFFENEKIE